MNDETTVAADLFGEVERAPEPAGAIMRQLTFLDAGDAGEERRYTGVLGSGIYEPKDRRPHILELVNASKTAALLREIEASGVSPEEKRYLSLAAHRHAVFQYELAADYYPDASAEMQRLMERSALVIIDFDSAIENGYVKLCKAVRAQYLEERGEDEA